MLILINLLPIVALKGLPLAHPFTGSTATSRAGSLGIGANGTSPSGVAVPVYRGIEAVSIFMITYLIFSHLLHEAF